MAPTGREVVWISTGRILVSCVFIWSVGCGNGGGGGSDPGRAFVGTWSCNGTFTNMFTSPEVRTVSGEYTERLQITESADGSMSVEVHFREGSTCMKRATVSGPLASFAGQSCPTGGGKGTVTYTSGTLALSGSTLLETGSGGASGTIAGKTLVATQTFNATCTKQ